MVASDSRTAAKGVPCVRKYRRLWRFGSPLDRLPEELIRFRVALVIANLDGKIFQISKRLRGIRPKGATSNIKRLPSQFLRFGIVPLGQQGVRQVIHCPHRVRVFWAEDTALNFVCLAVQTLRLSDLAFAI